MVTTVWVELSTSTLSGKFKECFVASGFRKTNLKKPPTSLPYSKKEIAPPPRIAWVIIILGLKVRRQLLG